MFSATSTEAESKSTPEQSGVDAFLERHGDRHLYYGAGKVALRDALSPVADRGSEVLLPSYVPDAVGEPIRDLGLEPAYYAVRDDLAADLRDLESRLSAATAAVVSVDYFGFPQPTFDDVAALASRYGAVHVEDNAHAAFSVADGTLLGTRGDVGFASFRKILPVPDGAVLFVPDRELAERLEPSRYAGVNDRYGAADCQFVLGRIASRVVDGWSATRRAIDAVAAATGADPATVDPADRYAASKRRMSKLTRRRLATADPGAIRDRRRDNYRAWADALEPVAGAAPLEPELPAGVCPGSFPVVVDRPASLLDALRDRGVEAHTWPRLPAAVRDGERYGTARRLSNHLVTVPTGPSLDPTSIDAIGRAVSSTADAAASRHYSRL